MGAVRWMTSGIVCLAAAGCLAASGCGVPPGAGERFFAGKTIRIVVSRPPGGSYDLQARVLARYLGRHLPGDPQVIVENMPGASGLAAPVYVATRAERDGLTLGFFGPEMVLVQLDERRRPGIRVTDIAFLGSPSAVDRLCVFSKRSRITDLQSWRAARVPPRLGASARGGLSYVTAMVLKKALGLPIRIVQGYIGSAEIRHAVESGEVDGACSGGEGFEVFDRPGDSVVPVLRVTPSPMPGIEHVPEALDIAGSDEARELIRIGIYDVSMLSRFVAAPAGVNAERLAVLRRAVMSTFDDPELRRETSRAGIKVAPISSEQLEAAVERVLAPGPRSDFLRQVVVPR